MAVAFSISNSNKRIRSGSDFEHNHESISINADNSMSADIQSWLNSPSISKQIQKACNSFKSIHQSLNKARDSLNKTNEYTSKNVIPPSLRQTKPLSLPDGCDEEQHKATQIRTQYEKEMLSLVVTARSKEVEKWSNKMKDFFNHQQTIMKAIIEQEHQALADVGIQPIDTIDNCLSAFSLVLQNKVRSIVSTIAIKTTISKQKAEQSKVDRMIEEEKVFNNTEKSVREIIKEQVQKQVQQQLKGMKVQSISTTPSRSNSSKKKKNQTKSSSSKTKNKKNVNNKKQSNSNKSNSSSSSTKSKNVQRKNKQGPDIGNRNRSDQSTNWRSKSSPNPPRRK
jgi:hypothetical protein